MRPRRRPSTDGRLFSGAAGKYRVVCSGDSFTPGYGVATPQAWCARLSILDPRRKTVNMGQGGYGVVQAYLWFKRDAPTRHHVHLRSFAT